ncbi:MAG: NAD(P)-dependent oxidoreductase [Chloroflexi bacterium]|nr:NAD(P)-dependent oxidoreductase [Chloroflexota bacterium]
MNILITSAASALAADLAAAFASEHNVRLTDVGDVSTPFPFVRCDLGHAAATDRLVEDVDVLIHLADCFSTYADDATGNAADSANRLIDYQTRCTYNLLLAASEAGVPRCIYASSLSLFTGCEEDWAVDEQWRPRPSPEPTILAQHLGEFTCREFAREGRLAITCLRLGKLEHSDDADAQPDDPLWLARADAVHAFQCALAAPPEPWAVYHIQSAFPEARFSTDKARAALGYAPRQRHAGEAS